MKACRLNYKSIAVEETLTDSGLKNMLDQCNENNAKLKVTGILLVTGNQFLQVLEGPIKFVNEIFCKIMLDKRHHTVELIDYGQIYNPFFFYWSMRLVNVEQLPEPTRNDFLVKYPQLADSAAYPDDPILIHALLLDAKHVCQAAVPNN